MKTILFSLAAGALVLTGCSSAYRTAETPDDVYYSYGASRPAVEDRYESRDEEYVSYWDDSDDRYLRMKVRDRDRWRQLDDLAYWNGGMSMTMGWGIGFNPWNNWNTWNAPFGWNNWNNWNTWNTWNNPWGWNGWGGGWNHPFAFNQINTWNNPWCWNRPVVFVDKNPTRPVTYYSPRPGFNRGGFNNSLFDRGNASGTRTTGGKPAYQQPGYGNGSLFRTIFSGGSNSSGSSNNNSWSRPARYFDGGSNSGSSFGGSSGGSSRTSGSSSSGSSSSGSSSSGGGGRGGRGGN